ncbi:hypothetical protein L6452_02152 [Arctium lappa]|uniref:Uncharacterized protein n=1 Tax=Arctium lappa TaxID=4217 RepID=A0ACB9FJN5_ARCLA|nr:hypothetical protein L6452_02152 [Arctium lappa]
MTESFRVLEEDVLDLKSKVPPSFEDDDKEGDKNTEEDTIADRPTISKGEQPQQQLSLARGRADEEDEDNVVFITLPPPISSTTPLIEPVHTTDGVEADEEEEHEDDERPEIPDHEDDD